VQKLCLYAAGSGEITLEDVQSIIGDASAFDVDEAIDAIALGDTDSLARAWRRLIATGTPGVVIAGAAIRHFNFLHRARAAYEGGERPSDLVARAMPPIFFKRRDNVERAIGLWPNARIERALATLDQAMLDSRLRGAITDEVLGQSMMMISTLVARRAQTAAG